jgi:dynein heavy chain
MDPKTFATRVEDLIDSLTINSFEFVRRGLFDKHKLIVSSILCFRILIKKQILTEQEVTHLVLGKIAMDNPKQPDSLKWMEYNQYIACKGLEQLPKFTNFGQSLDSDKTYWQKWYNET